MEEGEVSQKIRSAIKAKLMEIGVYVDEELPDYVMVMVANKRSKAQMDDDLQLFLGKHTSVFTSWLHQVLQKLEKVTVPSVKKRKLPEESKKKKKTKQDVEIKEPKKKIKVEPEDEVLPKAKESGRESRSSAEKEGSSLPNQQDESGDPKPKEKEKTELKPAAERSKHNEPASNKAEDGPRASRCKSRSTSSQVEDLDDEDCINIRTDGELLDTAEEAHSEDLSRKPKGNKESVSSKIGEKDSEKKCTTVRKSPAKEIEKPKSSEHNNDKEAAKKQPSPHSSPPKINDKVVDARELLNRKKAAKQSDSRGRSRSRDRSVSPPRKRRDDDRETHRNYRDDRRVRDSDRRVPRDDDRDRRRDSHVVKRREDRSRRTDSDRDRRRDSSSEPPPKRVLLERTFRNKNDDWEGARSSKSGGITDNRKLEIESSAKRREPEDTRKRGLVSRVVPRTQEPEEDVDAPVPSVVKVTPRPRRPPSQQPSSTLIMRAISEANKSLASVPQRPDSTQRARKEPVFSRTLRQLQRVPPEKIAVSITNPLAINNEGSEKEELGEPASPTNDEMTASKRTLSQSGAEATPSEAGNQALNEANPMEERLEEEVELPEEQEVELELEATPELDQFDEPPEDMSDPQFVVTLNGYDPDGLYSQSELDGEGDEWLKENPDEDPLLTSTPHEVASPAAKRERNSSPIVIMNPPAVNHANLIEVELVKPKSTERCKYWPACKLADKCTYYHPSKPCMMFPKCKFGDTCLYIHPQCKFNALCTRKDCVFAHTPAHSPSQPAAAPKAKLLYAASAPQPCKFYPNCTNIHCQFAHPPRACRFGLYCTKKDCSFDHGQIAPVDKLKWTRVPTT